MGMGDPFEPKIWKYPINANKKYNKKKIGGYVSDPLQASTTSHGVKMHDVVSFQLVHCRFPRNMW